MEEYNEFKKDIQNESENNKVMLHYDYQSYTKIVVNHEYSLHFMFIPMPPAISSNAFFLYDIRHFHPSNKAFP